MTSLAALFQLQRRCLQVLVAKHHGMARSSILHNGVCFALHQLLVSL